MSEPKFHVSRIPSPYVGRFWQYAEPYIKRALDHMSGEFSPANFKADCEEGHIQLWLVSEGDRVIAAVTTEIVTYPNRKHCRVITLAGSKAPEWTSLVDTILADWAKSHGCVALEAFVRKGYVPILAKYGYKHKFSAIIKDIG